MSRELHLTNAAATFTARQSVLLKLLVTFTVSPYGVRVYCPYNQR
jgi:hypothetical protein